MASTRLNQVALAGIGLVAACAPPRSINVSVGGAGTTAAACIVDVDGVRMSLDQFAASIRRWRGREVHLRSDVNVPYRCLGPVIHTLQRAPARRIGFISAPALEPDPSR